MRGGVRGVVDVRWHSRVVRDEFRVRGTDGEIDLSPLNGPELVYPGGRGTNPAPENLHYPLHRGLCRRPLSAGLAPNSTAPGHWPPNG